MPAKSATSRKWIAGALHAARAAAFLTIATGVNGTLSAVWPHYEPIYAYLIAVVVVAFLSSAVLGITAAVAAVILYDWMFAPVRIVPSMSIAIPMAIAVVIALATRAVVRLRERPALAVPVSEPPLLPAIDRAEPVVQTPQAAAAGAAAAPPAVIREVEYVVDETRIRELTEKLAAAETAARARETELRTRESALRSELEREIQVLHARAEDQANRSVAARREIEEMRARVEQAETRATALQQGLEAAQRRADDAQARLAREVEAREHLEAASHESLQNAVADLTTKHDATVLELKQKLEVATKRVEAVQREAVQRAQAGATGTEKLQTSLSELQAKHDSVQAEAKKTADAAAVKLKALQMELDRTLASLSQEHNRADREARLRAQLEAAARETIHRTADVSASHQKEAEEARKAAEAAEQRAAAAEEESRTAAERARMAQDQVQTADERARAAEERALIAEQQFEQLRFEISELRTSHDEKQQVATSAEERLALMQAEIDQLRATADDQLREANEAKAALQSELNDTKREFEQVVLREELETAAHAKLAAEHESTKQTVANLRKELEAVTQRRSEEVAREYDERLRKIVDGINADYEAAMGEALMGREAAKAELRAANHKLQELQLLRNELAAAKEELQSIRAHADTDRDQLTKAFDEKLQRIVTGITQDYENQIGDSLVEREAAKAEMRTMTKKIEMLQQKLDEEKRLRDRIEKEWDDKLQKIVTHITEDHEADLGEAIVQKEGARAEARTLQARVGSLQQRLEEEREKFRQAAERWQQERSSLTQRNAITPTIDQEMPPQTAGGRTPVVLIVHSDAGVRALTKHNLQQAGYEVITAADGLEGLRTATQQKPDVVLAEAVMPKMNARELVQLLKSRRETAEIKVILISATAEPERLADFRADEVVRNPNDTNDLRNALSNVLGRVM